MDNRANKLADQVMASGNTDIMNKTAVNPNANKAEFDRLTALGDPKKASLFAPTTSVPRGRSEILNAITQNYSKDQINRKGRANFDMNAFLQYLN